MTDVTIKKEKPDPDSTDGIDSSLQALTNLLEEVKREDEAEMSNANIDPIAESFFDDLCREECGSLSPDSVAEADIQKLRELLQEKKNELKEIDLIGKDIGWSKSRNSNPRERIDNSLKANTGLATQKRTNFGKRRRSNSDSSSNHATFCIQNRTPQEPSKGIEEAHVSEMEVEHLLKTDDETESNAFPTTVPMSAQTCEDESYPVMYNMQPFYPPNWQHMPMMGYGLPQINIPDQNDLQCLPVVNNAGFCGMPSFKRIKLERNSGVSSEEISNAEESAENRRKKVAETCTALLKHLESEQPIGKFIFTSTVGKLHTASVSNSIVQKVLNVTYEFHSIGPKLNLAEWQLKEIGNFNASIAKKVSISANDYFAKIAEKANTVVRKLIKVEDTKAHENDEEIDMEIEEPILSTFLKNSMTQTDAQVCRECVKKKRVVGHDISVQATVYTGSIGSQTSFVDDNVRLSAELSSNQIKALCEFSSLIREPPKSTSAEFIRLRDRLMDIYNLSQRRNVENTPINELGMCNRPNLDAISSPPRGMPIPTRKPFTLQASRNPAPHMNYFSYQPHTYLVRGPQPPAAQFPGYPTLQDARQNHRHGDQRR